MRLKAKEELTYAGKVFQAGALFDALERDGLVMINHDQAERFSLEDPSARTLEDMIDNLRPPAPPPEPLPDVPPVAISPTSATALAAGETGKTFDVAITGEGVSGTWTVEVEASALWITVVSPTTPQSTDGRVDYDVAENLGVQRSGDMTVNGETFTVTQDAGSGARSGHSHGYRPEK